MSQLLHGLDLRVNDVLMLEVSYGQDKAQGAGSVWPSLAHSPQLTLGPTSLHVLLTLHLQP